MFPGGGLPAQVGLALRLNNSTIETPNSPFEQVYLRVCGGTLRDRRADGEPQGLSPRVRRYPYSRYSGVPERRSISACAEVPGPSPARLHLQRVYLRVCGGTRFSSTRVRHGSGLSPRVRRYPCGEGHSTRSARSISACAEVHCDTLSGRAINRQVR